MAALTAALLASIGLVGRTFASGRPAEATFCLLLALASMVGLALGAMAP